MENKKLPPMWLGRTKDKDGNFILKTSVIYTGFLPEDQKETFDDFMVGQGRPTIVEVPGYEYDWVFYSDYERFYELFSKKQGGDDE